MSHLHIPIRDFVKMINREFGQPYLDEGHVSARMVNGGVWLCIGRRDVLFDKEGAIRARGTIDVEERTDE
jgi:hypothetical protein